MQISNNKSIKSLYIFLSLSLFQCGGITINAIIPCEKAFLHINKTVYSSGEDVLFKAYLLNSKTNKPDTFTKILYVCLVNSQNQKIVTFHTNLKKGTSDSYFTLPDTLSSGFYYIKAFSANMRNYHHEGYFVTKIVVINQGDDIIDKLISREKNTESVAQSTVTTNSQIIRMEKEVYKTNDDAEIQLNFPNSFNSKSDVSVSVSIIPSSLYRNIGYKPNSIQDQNNNHVPVQCKGYCMGLPENKGLILYGKVLNKENVPQTKVNVLLSTEDSVVNLKYCYTDTSGLFFFRLTPYYDNKNIVLQIVGGNEKNYRIEIEDKFNDEPQIKTSYQYVSNDERNFMADINKANLVAKALRLKYTNILNIRFPENFRPECNFYGKEDYGVLPSDFSDLANFREFALNILPGVTYKKAKDAYELKVLDRELQKFSKNNAMVFLNGIPYPDANVLYSLNTKQVKKIDIKLNHLSYGNLEIDGILAVKTYKELFAIENRNTSVVIQNTAKDNPCYLENTDNPVVPDVRQTIFWNTNYKVGNNQTLKFKTSSIKGWYLIDIEGVDVEGNLISEQKYFEVK